MNKMVPVISPFCQFTNIDNDYCECIHCNLTMLKKDINGKPMLTCPAAMKKLGITGDFRYMVPAPIPPKLNTKTQSTIKTQFNNTILNIPKHSYMNGGPGTELKQLLKFMGITASPNCKCNARAKQMDIWGCDVCETKIDEIVGWLKEEAYNRKLPFVEIAAKLLVKRAIKNARKKLKPSP